MWHENSRILKLAYILAVASPPAILLSPVFLTGKALFWGLPALQFVPWWVQAWTSIQEGSLPLWNPLVGMGAPLLANYQLAFFYPPNWLYLAAAAVGGTAGIAWIQAPSVALHLVWAGLGMACLVRELKLNRLAQVSAGLAFGLSGYLVARGWFLSMNVTLAWLPWILYATTLFARDVVRTTHGRDQVRSILRLAMVLALQLLGGHAQIAWYSILLATVWFAYWVFEYGKQEDSDIRIIEEKNSKTVSIYVKASLIFAMTGVIALVLSAIQLIPTAEYLLQSSRAYEVDFEQAMVYSFWPWRLLGLVTPGFFGNPSYGDYWGYATFWEDALYIGLAPFLLAIRVIFSRKLSKQMGRLRILLVTIIVVSLTLAFGTFTPIYKVLYEYVPTFGMFQSPARWAILAVISISLLAAIGVDQWRRPSGKNLYWTRLGVVAMLAVTIGAVVGGIILAERSDVIRLTTMVRSAALAGLLGVGLLLFSLTIPQQAATRGTHLRWKAGVIIYVTVDLLIAGWALNPGIDLSFYRDTPDSIQRLRQAMDTGRYYIPTDLEQKLKYEQLFQFSTFNATYDWSIIRESLLPNINLLDHIASANNFDPLKPARYSNWIKHIERFDGDQLTMLLNLMNVQRVVKEDSDSWTGVSISMIQENKRFLWVPCVEFFPDPVGTLDRTLRIALESDNRLVIEDDVPDTIQNCDLQGDATIEIRNEKSDEIILIVKSSHPGWLYQADVWYPGWHAWVNDELTEIKKANYLFRATYLPAGESDIRILYRPAWLIPSVIISGAGWLVCLLAWWVQRSK